MAILTFSARTSFAEYILACPIHLAVGTGSLDWGSVPDPPDYEAESLINEIGRKKISQAFFVNEDDDGDIDMPGGRRYSFSDKPTRHIFMNFIFDYGEGINTLIREMGIFINTKIKNGIPDSQSFFTPDQIDDKGTLIVLEHFDFDDSDKLSPKKKGGYRTILTI